MNSSEKEGTTNNILLSLDLNVKDGNNFCAGVSKPWLFTFVDPCLFLFFSKICTSKLGVRLIDGCGLYTDVYGTLNCDKIEPAAKKKDKERLIAG